MWGPFCKGAVLYWGPKKGPYNVESAPGIRILREGAGQGFPVENDVLSHLPGSSGMAFCFHTAVSTAVRDVEAFIGCDMRI